MKEALVNRLRKFLNPPGTENFNVSHQTAHFQLNLEDLPIGFLDYRNEHWYFNYSEQFKETKGIKPLANFPDINKEYKTQELWPFFVSRIPSLSRKRVKKAVEEQGINETDMIELLSQFGRKTVTNPFELITK